ncbi:MAG: hypothetical protein RR203_02430 [Synergistaceae bacterium]
MEIEVYQSELGREIEKELIGKLRYVGETFGSGLELTNGEIYDVIEIDGGDMLRVVDDSEEDYLYSIETPAPLDGSSEGGRWEIVEDYTGELGKIFKGLNQ